MYEVNAPYRVGEEVVLIGSTTMGMRAVALAFGVPVLLLILALFVTMRVTDGDALVSSLVALLAVVPYYLVIYFMKDKLNKTFSFTIEKQ